MSAKYKEDYKFIYFRKYGKASVMPMVTVSDADNLKVSRVKLPVLGSLHNLLWYVAGGFRRIVEYRLIKNCRVVSTAQVVGHLPIFRFFKNGIHIGPCQTIPEERGRGYYPWLLQQIAEDYPKEDSYMIVKSTNVASLKGVTKAGYVPYAYGHKAIWGGI